MKMYLFRHYVREFFNHSARILTVLGWALLVGLAGIAAGLSVPLCVAMVLAAALLVIGAAVPLACAVALVVLAWFLWSNLRLAGRSVWVRVRL